MSHSVFIDGQAGTTGLQIHEHLSRRGDVELLAIPAERRKDSGLKQEIMRAADIVVLCLPDDAAREAVALAAGSRARILDASTAHRIDPDWHYGLPEMETHQRERISEAALVSNPGCYATAYVLALRPLVTGGLLAPESLVHVQGMSGYTGGGHKLIERYERRASERPDDLWHIRPYGLSLTHKHLPEMRVHTCMRSSPHFSPSVGHFAQGMIVTIALFRRQLTGDADVASVHGRLQSYYADEPCITVHALNDDGILDDGYLDPQLNNETNRVDLLVFGHHDQLSIVAVLDNLGKGACGAAIQNLNLMLGCRELTGLTT